MFFGWTITACLRIIKPSLILSVNQRKQLLSRIRTRSRWHGRRLRGGIDGGRSSSRLVAWLPRRSLNRRGCDWNRGHGRGWLFRRLATQGRQHLETQESRREKSFNLHQFL